MCQVIRIDLGISSSVASNFPGRYDRLVAEPTQLDDLDASIIEELYREPRAAYREIARRLEVSEGTIRTRVRRLQDSGTLLFTAFVDPAKFGRSVLAVALVDVVPSHHTATVDELVEWHEVVYLSTLFGEHALQLQLAGESEKHLWELLQRVQALPGVTGVHSQIETEVHKIRYIAPRNA